MNVKSNLLEIMNGYFKQFPNIEKVVLFGSRARGDNTERSDYDIAVYGPVTVLDRAYLRSLMEDKLPTLHKIDLIFMCEQVNSAFIANIENEGVKIYEKS